MNKRLILGLFLEPQGYHVAGWRHPDAKPGAFSSFANYHAVAKAAEAARFDFVFMADAVSVRDQNHRIVCQTAGSSIATLEPLTLLSALSVTTKHIGLIATASTTYNEPYNIARKFASIDHLSGGRAGWNLVTTNGEAEARNFDRGSHPLHADRYARAGEFVDIVRGLWDSWDDEAFHGSKESGFHTQPEQLHTLDFKGEHFSVRGPLNIARPPQGYPVIAQAGSSDPGRALAARSADIVYTAQTDVAAARLFYADVKARTVAQGRSEDSIKIMPGLFVIVAETQARAQELHESLQALVPLDVAVARLSGQLGGFDLSEYPVDGPLPEMPETNGPKSRQKLLLDTAAREQLSIRQLAMRNSGARGHLTVVGTPQQIVDLMAYWLETRAADGFNIIAPYLPTGLSEFNRLVLPELRRRGLFPDTYTGSSLRENLGLARPERAAGGVH